MEKSICILSHSFTLDSATSFDEFQSELKTLPTSKNPITLVDPKKYYPHIYQNKGILNIEDQNIFQFEIAGFKKKDFSAIEDLLEKSIYLDDEKKIELDVSSIKWMFILDAKCELGFLFYIFDLEIRSENCLESLSKTKIFRYLKEPGKDPKNYMYKLKVCENEKIIGYTSFYSILTNCLGKLSDGLNFLEAKPLQFHFLGKSAFSNDFERESFCYKLLRIPANPNIEIDKKYFDKNQKHVYENSSIYAFSMAEGIVLTSFEKTPKKLVSNFLATQIILLFHRRFEHVISRFMVKNCLNHSEMSKEFVRSLKQIRKDMNLSNYYVSLPISQYSEIQEIYNLTKINSGLNQTALKEAFNEAALLLMEEADEANSERERRIGLILGVLGITGFISFIFDYLLISKNKKFIDTLDFPFNTLPFLLFFSYFYCYLEIFKHKRKMIDFIKKNEEYFLTLGHDFISNSPKCLIPVSKEEATEMANVFNEELAVAIGKNEAQWSHNEFKLTDAPDHPYGWTDSRERTILHYREQSWHMIPSEIAEIGRLVKRVLSLDV